MITKQRIQTIRLEVEAMARPLLSIYLNIDPADSHEARVRARETMQSLGVGDEVAKAVLAELESPHHRSPTTAIFANAEAVEVVGLSLELPMSDPRTGHVEARFGEPYLGPLMLALDQHEWFLVALVGRARCRAFEVYASEIEELEATTREPMPGEGDVLEQGRQTFPAFVPSRDDAGKDRASRHEHEWVRRFFERFAGDVEAALAHRDAERLIVLGPERDRGLFESCLSTSIRRGVAASEPGLPNAEAPPAEVLERLRPVVERVEAERTRRLIDRVLDEGARGTTRCLAELQQGRVHTVVAPWTLDDEVYEAHDGYVTMKADDADGARRVTLKERLPDLAQAYGARLTIARGENEQRLIGEVGGMGGLLRW